MKKPALHADWHKAHPMPAKATLEQRIQWHLEHHKKCGCRDIPEKLKAEMKKRKIKWT
jgi:hypothetical protein